MAGIDKTSDKKQRLLALLRTMFQLDQPDLDFGLYRIMHAKGEQLETFLASEFDQIIDKVFAGHGARQEEEAKKEYEAAKKQAVEFGAPDPESAPKVQQARVRYDAIRLTGGDDAEIYDHLYHFFSRYYDEGDFMSLRRYGKGAAGSAETYAIPYDGSEMALHWANKDQHYIKTTENFADFTFDPRKALQKDAKGFNRQLFDDATKAAPALRVHFKIVEADEGTHNNVKATEKDERYFMLDNTTPINWHDSDLVIQINYRPDPEKSGQKAKWQEKRNEQLVQRVFEALGNAPPGRKLEAEEYLAVLSREVPKGKDKKQSLLARYLSKYTANNTMDYFIHKDLSQFLNRELDFYLKNEVLKLDDFIGSDETESNATVSDTTLNAMRSALSKAQAIRLLSHSLIAFLAQLEDFQKKLWLKKKFVVESHYCLTLDRIPEHFYPAIVANEKQHDEWVELYAIDQIAADIATPGYSKPLTVEFLKANLCLSIDTAHFEPKLVEDMLAAIDELDRKCCGLLIHSDNFQALRFIDAKHAKDIKGIYIDPPYNTDASPIVYKNNYQHSTWATLFVDRLEAAQRLTKPSGMICVAIDDFEYANLFNIMEGHFGFAHLGTAVVRSKPQGRPTTSGFSSNHEYAGFWSWGATSKVGRLPRIGSKAERYPHRDELGIYAWANFRKSGTDSDRTDRRKSFYPVYVMNKVARIPAMTWDDESELWQIHEQPTPGEAAIWPKDQEGNDKVWTCSAKRLAREMVDLRVVQADDGSIELQKKYRPNQDGALPGTWWENSDYSASESGTKVLKNLFKAKDFDFPKSINLVIDNLRVLDINANDWVLDYFGGSGTTAAAVIALNREDGGNRKFVLAEQGTYFDSVLKPRVQKEMYSSEWRSGVPIARDSMSYCIKYIRLESYEDCLNNLILNARQDAVSQTGEATLQRDYLLRYMLQVETQGSTSLLNISQFRNPTECTLEVRKANSDERVSRSIDLVETFNWLIGLHVDKLHASQRYSATFSRRPDPLLPKDANARFQVEKFTLDANGSWWFRAVEGFVRATPGDERHRQNILVLWRTITDDPEKDAATLEAYLSQQMKFNPSRREDKALYDVIYVNGTHNLPTLGRYGEVRLLEAEFHRRMWSAEDA